MAPDKSTGAAKKFRQPLGRFLPHAEAGRETVIQLHPDNFPRLCDLDGKKGHILGRNAEITIPARYVNEIQLWGVTLRQQFASLGGNDEFPVTYQTIFIDLPGFRRNADAGFDWIGP
ncbi:MAG TPA: hypothetical protein VGE05_13580 [Novosphingobium sp.]